MDVMIQWFWIIKLVLFIIFAFALYKSASNKLKSRFWNFAAVFAFILAIVSPIKMDVNTSVQTTRANEAIKNSKILPEKVTDDSFKERTKGLGINEFEAK